MQLFETSKHPITDPRYAKECADRLAIDGALVLREFFTPAAIAAASKEANELESSAFFSRAVHNVYLAGHDEQFTPNHIRNREIVSQKGLIADDLISLDSPLRAIYNSDEFRIFLERTLGTGRLYPYPDKLSTIVISVARAGENLGWHFDTSSFSVTMLLQAPVAGGRYDFVPNVRNVDVGETGYEQAAAVVDGKTAVRTLDFSPGDLVVFRGQNALHRVTACEGGTSRSIAIFAFNEDPNATMTEAALTQFFGRTR